MSQVERRMILCLTNQELFGSTAERYVFGFAGKSLMNDLPDVVMSDQFYDRDYAEEFSGIKQIIPYVALQDAKTNSFLTYRRGKAGEESRLHDKRSFGFGGHIDQHKVPVGQNDFAGIVWNAAVDELREELRFVVKPDQDVKHVGFVFEDETKVGQVHFGVCFVINLSDDQLNIVSAETCIDDVKFQTQAQIAASLSEYELWSQYLFRGLTRGNIPA